MKSFINARSRGKAEAEAVAATWKPDADCHASCCAPPTPAGCCCNVPMQQRRNASLCAWNYASNFNPWQQATSKCARHEILALGFPSTPPPSPLPPSFSLSPCSLLCLLPALSRTYLQLALCINGATLSAQHSHAACKGGDGEGMGWLRGVQGLGYQVGGGTNLTPRGRGPVKLYHAGSKSCAAECAQSINYSPIFMATRRTHHSSLCPQKQGLTWN